MILRSWSGVTLPERAADYIRYLETAILPELRSISGHRGAYVLRRDLGSEVEFQVLSLWDSMDDVRGFAEDVDVAVVPAQARALLERFDAKARHHDIVFAPDPAH